MATNRDRPPSRGPRASWYEAGPSPGGPAWSGIGRGRPKGWRLAARTGRPYPSACVPAAFAPSDGFPATRHPFLFLTACGLAGTALHADDKKPAAAADRAAVVKFLKANVIGRTVVQPKVSTKLAAGAMEAEEEGRTTFTNLSETADGFAFDIVDETQAFRYGLDKDGKRVGTPRDVGGTGVIHAEFGEHEAADRHHPHHGRDGQGRAVGSWAETVPGYFDMTAPGAS